jgi:hypothetical protein
MPSHTVTFTAEPGLTLSAYPRYTTAGAEVVFASADAVKVACTEDPFTVYSLYEVDVTESYAEWWIMPTSASSWSDFSGVRITFENNPVVIPTSASGSSDGRPSAASLTVFKDEEPEITVNLTDTDLTGLDLEFVIEDQEQNDKEVIASGDITAGEDYFTLTIPATITDEIGTYRWSLRDITGGGNTVISFGVLSVNYAASNDP